MRGVGGVGSALDAGGSFSHPLARLTAYHSSLTTPGGCCGPTALVTGAEREGETLVTVRWRNVKIKEFKLDRLKEVVEMESDWEAVDEAINRVLFTEEIRSMLDESDESGDEPVSAADDDTGLPWDA